MLKVLIRPVASVIGLSWNTWRFLKLILRVQWAERGESGPD